MLKLCWSLCVLFTDNSKNILRLVLPDRVLEHVQPLYVLISPPRTNVEHVTWRYCFRWTSLGWSRQGQIWDLLTRPVFYCSAVTCLMASHTILTVRVHSMRRLKFGLGTNVSDSLLTMIISTACRTPAHVILRKHWGNPVWKQCLLICCRFGKK